MECSLNLDLCIHWLQHIEFEWCVRVFGRYYLTNWSLELMLARALTDGQIACGDVARCMLRDTVGQVQHTTVRCFI